MARLPLLPPSDSQAQCVLPQYHQPQALFHCTLYTAVLLPISLCITNSPGLTTAPPCSHYTVHTSNPIKKSKITTWMNHVTCRAAKYCLKQLLQHDGMQRKPSSMNECSQSAPGAPLTIRPHSLLCKPHSLPVCSSPYPCSSLSTCAPSPTSHSTPAPARTPLSGPHLSAFPTRRLQEELASCFSPDCTLQVRPGADNFFRGVEASPPRPGAARAMTSSARAFYGAWELGGGAEAALAAIASPRLRICDPMWEEQGAFLPVNRVEAAMWVERKVKQCGGELRIEPKAVTHARGTNMVLPKPNPPSFRMRGVALYTQQGVCGHCVSVGNHVGLRHRADL